MKNLKYIIYLMVAICSTSIGLMSVNATTNYHCVYNSQYDVSLVIIDDKVTSVSYSDFSSSAFSKVEYEGFSASELSPVCPEYITINFDSNGIPSKIIGENNKQTSYKLTSSYDYRSDYTKDKGGCSGYDSKSSCENNYHYSCIWNETEYGNYCNVDKLQYVSCGDAFDIPSQVPSLISFVVNLLKIATPIILIVVSIITLLKALAASKEDEIKKAQNSLVKKMIAAAMVFFVITIVQFVISKVADDSEQTSLSQCLTCFLNNDCDNSLYYKTNVGGTYMCTYLTGTKKEFKCKGN